MQTINWDRTDPSLRATHLLYERSNEGVKPKPRTILKLPELSPAIAAMVVEHQQFQVILVDWFLLAIDS
jgi:hypothetical protein